MSSRSPIGQKTVYIIVVAAVGVVAAGLTVYWYVNQQLIQTQYDISYKEDCSTRAESLKQKVQDAIASGMPFEEWNRIYQPEGERLNAECDNILKK